MLNGSAGAGTEWNCPDRGPLQRIGILSRGDDVSTDDALRLRVAGVDATVTEYRITEEERVAEDRTRTVELFHGFVLSMPAPRAVSGRVRLCSCKGRAFVGKGWFQKPETRLEHPGLHDELLIACDGDGNFFELDWRSKASVQECLVRICGELDQVITLADALGAFDPRLARPE